MLPDFPEPAVASFSCLCRFILSKRNDLFLDLNDDSLADRRGKLLLVWTSYHSLGVLLLCSLLLFFWLCVRVGSGSKLAVVISFPHWFYPALFFLRAF